MRWTPAFLSSCWTAVCWEPITPASSARTTNRSAKAAGEWIVKALGGKGNVVELMGLQTSTPGQDRHSGFLEGIAGSDIKIIFSADMKWLEPNARQEMESALSRFDKIDLRFCPQRRRRARRVSRRQSRWPREAR